MTEKKEKRKRPLQETYYYPVIFMVAVTVVFISVLAYLNDSTANIIELNNEAKTQESVLYALAITNDGTQEGVRKTFAEKVEETDSGYRSKDTGALAFFFTGDGLWGKIDGYLAVSGNLDSIEGVTFTEHSETPGLGGRIDELWFKEQFRGIELKTGDEKPIAYRPAPGGTVDAISGATSTSNAVVKILNASLAETLNSLKGGM